MSFLRGLRLGYCSRCPELILSILFFSHCVLSFPHVFLYFIHSRPFHPLPLTSSSSFLLAFPNILYASNSRDGTTLHLFLSPCPSLSKSCDGTVCPDHVGLVLFFSQIYPHDDESNTDQASEVTPHETRINVRFAARVKHPPEIFRREDGERRACARVEKVFTFSILYKFHWYFEKKKHRFALASLTLAWHDAIRGLREKERDRKRRKGKE